MITLLDYGAGNVRSVINALESLGETVRTVASGEDILSADKLVFPGVGAFGSMMRRLGEKNYIDPLKAYLQSDRPFFGICMGMQALFESSEEAPGIGGLGIFKGTVKRFATGLSVPHIGWNGLIFNQPSRKERSGTGSARRQRRRKRVERGPLGPKSGYGPRVFLSC